MHVRNSWIFSVEVLDDIRESWNEHEIYVHHTRLYKMDAIRKKEARTTKDNMAKDSNDRATRCGSLMGRSCTLEVASMHI